jgi:hypothetical protein
MYAVEFQATIENGIVHIPKKYKDLQKKRGVRFFVMYDDNNEHKTIIKKREKKMNAISIDTIDFKFDRDEVHER